MKFQHTAPPTADIRVSLIATKEGLCTKGNPQKDSAQDSSTPVQNKRLEYVLSAFSISHEKSKCRQNPRQRVPWYFGSRPVFFVLFFVFLLWIDFGQQELPSKNFVSEDES